MKLWWLPVFAAVALASSACQDPCVQLAERICSCEDTASDRSLCRTERIVNQQSHIQITDADRDACQAALATCDCNALDQNDLEKCAFVPQAGEGEGE